MTDITIRLEQAEVALQCIQRDIEGETYPDLCNVNELLFCLLRAELRERLTTAINNAKKDN